MGLHVSEEHTASILMIHFILWRINQYIPPKRWCPYENPNIAITQEATILV
jgi:hypothetical protein